jgi:hypothetical protein
MEAERVCKPLSYVLDRSIAESYIVNSIRGKVNIEPYIIFDVEDLDNVQIRKKYDTIVLKKGLILYHMTATKPNQMWTIPKSGTFFSYNILHPLNVLREFDYYGSILNNDYIGQLKRFILIKDVTLVIDEGASHPCNTNKNYKENDGSISGWYDSDRDEYTYQEIILCDGKSVEYIDQILITKDFVVEASNLFEKLNRIGNSKKFVPKTPLTCPPQQLYNQYEANGLQLWHVDNVMGLMYLFEYLRDKISYIYRFMMFDQLAAVYIISKINEPQDVVGLVITTFTKHVRSSGMYKGFLKIWTSADYKHKKTTWPLVESLLSYETTFLGYKWNSYRFVMIQEDLNNFDNEGLDYKRFIEDKLPYSSNFGEVKQWSSDEDAFSN